jgi:hypothetical protein
MAFIRYHFKRLKSYQGRARQMPACSYPSKHDTPDTPVWEGLNEPLSQRLAHDQGRGLASSINMMGMSSLIS